MTITVLVDGSQKANTISRWLNKDREDKKKAAKKIDEYRKMTEQNRHKMKVFMLDKLPEKMWIMHPFSIR